MKDIPLATYRIQFTPQFGFAACRKVLPYLQHLGVSHIYASPVFRARPGSTHGYDVCDHNVVNPELGTAEEFESLLGEAKKLGLGWIQDIVPNHMAVSGDNHLLVDVLENGPDSRYFGFLDIDWEHPYQSMHGRMLAPFLGGFYGPTLENGEIVLGFDEEGFFVRYYELRLPVRIDSYARLLTHGIGELREALGPEHDDYIRLLGILYSIRTLPPGGNGEMRYEQIYFIKRLLFELHQSSENVRGFVEDTLAAYNGGDESWDLLDGLLAEQHFRLSYWKVAGQEIDYRRFFSINDLICLRVEDERVFGHVHAFLLPYLEDGSITGLRVDHADGLYDPTAYLKRLREKAGDAYIIVEKILMEDEPLPSFWPVQGTTGYDFLNAVCGLFVDGAAEEAFEAVWRGFSGLTEPLEALIARKKRQIIERHMAGDVDNLARLVNRVSSSDRHGFDITMQSLHTAITELLTNFPVYRTYISHDAFRPADLTYIRSALRRTREDNPDLGPELDFLERFLLLEFEPRTTPEARREWINFVMRFQQFSGPLMAKGLEDSAFYIFNRLACLNEVGGWPGSFGLSPEGFHAFVQERMKLWPHAMNATATHDTKRGEDARMRLAALSALPGEWGETLKRLARADRRKNRGAPTRNDEYLLYQTVIASRPFEGLLADDFPQRLEEYMIKAVREAKERTGWLEHDEAYETAVTEACRRCLKPGERSVCRRELLPLAEKAAQMGVTGSLAQVLVKTAAPGVPDFYQGTELWDLALVDPDNRRPVDFPLRRQLLEGLDAAFADNPEKLLRELLARPEDGRIKLYVISRALAARRALPDLFTRGGYEPLAFSGKRAGKLFGFARIHEESAALAIVPLLAFDLPGEGRYPLGTAWEDSALELPGELRGKYRDAFTGLEVEARETLAVREILGTFPVALLYRLE